MICLIYLIWIVIYQDVDGLYRDLSVRRVEPTASLKPEVLAVRPKKKRAFLRA